MTPLPLARPFPASRLASRLCALAPLLLLCAAVGAELVVLVAWLPDTLRVWFHPDRAGFGDFPVFFRQGRTFYLNATYSPGLAVVMHPLSRFSMAHAFMIYTAVNVAALFGIAFAAQAGVRSLPAKAAMALGVLALPQSHWALRVGHFTPVLALALLGGLLLARRRPVLAGLLLGILALKPQYIIVPLLYLAWTRNWRALGACAGGLVALGLAGVAGAVVMMGTRVIGYTEHYYLNAVPAVLAHITVGQQNEIYVQGWQYSWYGFLVSAGIDPNPLIAGDLILLSACAMLLAWWKATPSVARVAAVLGLLLMMPHETFYNWTIIAVAAALLVRSDLRPRWLIPAMIAGLALAAVATQNATPFPIPFDAYRPPGTRGFFWLQPATLAVLVTLAVAGRPRLPVDEPSAATPPVRFQLPRIRLASLAGARVWGGALAALAAVAVGYLGAAYASNNAPFHSPPFFSRSIVLRALPADFPVVPGSRIDAAGAGAHLPYRVEWDAPASTSEVAGIMRQRLADGSWKIIDTTQGSGAGDLHLRTARAADAHGASVLADVQVTPDGSGSRVRLEFSPVPASSVPNYDRWLESIGIVVHNVPPDAPPPAHP
ncbi:MAG TPA: glycosyltransferase family 87 protein [Dehalococcoidia bacterium]|nr:glycosyltransferase family 87 protein [Dehalococcoidia bacterium]